MTTAAPATHGMKICMEVRIAAITCKRTGSIASASDTKMSSATSALNRYTSEVAAAAAFGSG